MSMIHLHPQLLLLRSHQLLQIQGSRLQSNLRQRLLLELSRSSNLRIEGVATAQVLMSELLLLQILTD